MRRPFALLALLAAVAEALTPVTIRWAGLPAKGFAIGPSHTLPQRGLVPPQKLRIWDQIGSMYPTDLPHFVAKSDGSISCAEGDLCLEANGDALFVNRCTGSPTQTWNVLPGAREGTQLLQLRSTQTCVAVNDQGDLQGAPIELQQCDGRLTELWRFEPPPRLRDPTHASVIRAMMISFGALASLGLMSFGAWLWRWRAYDVRDYSCAGASTVKPMQRTNISMFSSEGVETAGSPVVDLQKLGAEAEAVVIGAGPAGLASAWMLAQRGFNVTVLEKRSEPSPYEPQRAYLYLIDGRGQKFTDAAGLTQELASPSLSVSSVDYTVTRCLPDGERVDVVPPILEPATDKRCSYWIPRQGFLALQCRALAGNKRVRTLYGSEVLDVSRVADGGVEVSVRVGSGSAASTETMRLRPSLLIGADGLNSIVRERMAAWSSDDPSLGATASEFRSVELPSPSSGLNYKMLRFPPSFRIDASDTSARAEPRQAYSIRPSKDAPLGQTRLGMLPVAEESYPRTANVILPPNHPVWSLETGEAVRKWLKATFPQLPIDDIVSEDEANEFANGKPGTFPAPCYTPRQYLMLPKAGLCIVGDAVHAFPPDIGQGVNSALSDVMHLAKALDTSAVEAEQKLTVNFSPGALGLTVRKTDGKVRAVLQGQAQEQGVKVDMRMTRIGGQQFSWELFRSQISGTKDYEVEFIDEAEEQHVRKAEVGGNAADSVQTLIGRAMPAYGKLAGAEAEAVARIAQIGFPYQYGQVARDGLLPRLKKGLWFANFFLRTFVLAKLAPSIFSPSAIVMIQRPNLSYTEVLSLANKTTRRIAGCACFIASATLWLLTRRLLL